MSIEIQKITDYNTNLALLVDYYQNKPNFESILKVDNGIADQLETVFFDIRDKFFIDAAIGDQLDIIGSIHTEDRNGRGDDEYRIAIQNRIAVNQNSGEPESIIFALVNFYGATSVRIGVDSAAITALWADVLLSITSIQQIIQLLPAGVGLIFSFGSTEPFVMSLANPDGTTIDVDPDGLGFGSADSAGNNDDIGGKLQISYYTGEN